MPYLNRLRSGTLLYLRLMVVAFGLICGNIGLELLYNGSSFLFWLPLALLSIFLLVLPLLIKESLTVVRLKNDSLLLNKFTLVWAWHIWLLF